MVGKATVISMNVSVVIPTLNEENFIGICLESLINQTIKPDEIIIVDALSTDRTVEIAKRYTNKIIFSPVANIAYQRELGVRVAKGEYILLADADTVFPPYTIETMIENFKDPSVAAVTVDIAPLNPNPITHINCWFRNLITPNFTQRACCFMFKRSKVSDKDGFFSVNGEYISKLDIFPLRERLKGRIVKDTRITVLTDIPLEQQIQTILLISIAGLTGYLLYKSLKS